MIGSGRRSLTELDRKHRVCMLFDNEPLPRRPSFKRLYVVGASRKARNAAIDAVEEMVDFKLSKSKPRFHPYSR